MFENPWRGRQARNFTKIVPKILDLKSSSEQVFSENGRWVRSSPLVEKAFWIMTFRTTEFLDFGLVLRQLQISDCTQPELYSHIFDDEGTNLHKYVACVLINEFSSIE